MKNFISKNKELILSNNNLKTKKTKVESQIEVLKQQEQEISEQLKNFVARQKKS